MPIRPFPSLYPLSATFWHLKNAEVHIGVCQKARQMNRPARYDAK